MADWNEPQLTSTYANFLSYLKARDTDLAKLDFSTATNVETGTIQWVSASSKFQKYNGATWDDLLLSLAGGGTGASTAAGARTNLGLGTMATQAASAVAITGGSITGLSASLTWNANNTYDVGSNTNKVRKVYIGSAIVIPVGADKYTSS